MAQYRNISLIGMPGVGKSTAGILLAKALSWNFLDTDVVIQVAEERSLQQIVQSEGLERFTSIEQRHVMSLDRRQCVIATGGSVVYGPAGMEHLKSLGLVVHLDLPIWLLEKRMAGLNGRGPVIAPGQTLPGIHQQRDPLYRHYADTTVDCIGRNHEQVVDELIRLLG